MRAYQPAPRRPSVKGRQHHMGGRAEAAHREPAEGCGEDVEQEQCHDELRRRNAHEGQRHDGAIGETVAPDGGERAEEEAERHLDQDAGDHEHQRGGDARQDQRRDLAALDVGAAEIALQEAGQIAPELLGQRQVEAELMAHVGDHLGVGAAPGDERRGIGRQAVQQQER